VVIHELLAPYCAQGVTPHPDDALERFYGLDGDHQEDLVEELFHRFNLPLPSGRRPELIPSLRTPVELGLYFVRRRAELERSRGQA